MTKNTTTHYAYNYGILDFLGKQRTYLTLCDKTVMSGRINNTDPTCPNCLEIHNENEALRAILQDENPSLLHNHEHI